MPSPQLVRLVSVGLLLAILTPAYAWATVQGADGIAIDNYTLGTSTRLGRTVFEYTYTADVHNGSSQDSTITATLSSTSANVTVVQGALSFGDVAQNDTATSTASFDIRVDRSQPFDVDALVWTVQATPLPPTTYDLIDSASASGSIDAETALLYKVYYEFGDSRLPSQYVGRSGPIPEAIGFQAAADAYSTLSPPTQQILLPYLLPPANPQSWYALARQAAFIAHSGGQSAQQVSLAQPLKPNARIRPLDTATVTGCDPLFDPTTGALVEGTVLTANQKVCITYWAIIPGDQAKAQSLAAEIDATIWPALTTLFRQPILDAFGHLQIHLVDSANVASFYGADANTLGVTTTCNSATLNVQLIPQIYLNRDRPGLIETATHEIMHTIAATYNQVAACGEARWMDEATATWAIKYVYPCSSTVHNYAPALLGEPTVSLEDFSNVYHAYGAYLWFFYATKPVSSLSCAPGTRAGDPSYVPRAWQGLSGLDSLHAISAAFTGSDSLASKWHDFVLYNWNRDPSSHKPYTLYRDTDGLKTQAAESTGSDPLRVNLNGANAKKDGMSHTVPHLSANYWHFDLTKDSTIRRVRLVQPYAPSAGSTNTNTRVWAILKTDQGWQPAVDWTGFKQKTLCRDRSGENFQELVIIVSNSEFNNKSFVLKSDDTRTELLISGLGCTNWVGSAQTNYSGGPALPDGPFFPDVITSSTDAEGVKFTKDTEIWVENGDAINFKPRAGNVSWTFTEDSGIGSPTECTGKFSSSYTLPGSTEGSFMQLGDLSGGRTYYILGNTLSVNDDDFPLVCSNGLDGISSSVDQYVTAWLPMKQPAGIDDTNGGAFAGDLVGSGVLQQVRGTGNITYSYRFSKDSTTFDSDQP